MFVTGEPVLPVRAACHSPRPTDNIHHGRTEEMIHPGVIYLCAIQLVATLRVPWTTPSDSLSAPGTPLVHSVLTQFGGGLPHLLE